MATTPGAGVLVYARDLSRMSRFYASVLGLTPHAQDEQHHVLESADTRIVLHAIPGAIARSIQLRANAS